MDCNLVHGDFLTLHLWNSPQRNIIIMDNTTVKPAMGTEHHKKAAEHHELAAKFHHEAAKHHDAGNHEKAFESTIKAHAHHTHASEHQREDLKQHAK